MKTLAFIVIINAVEVIFEIITPSKASTSVMVTCPKDCDKPRLLDRNCLSCYKVDSNDTQDEMMLRTSTTQHNEMSCTYWQQVCIQDCSTKKPTAKEPPTVYEIYICEEKYSNEEKNVETVLPHDNTKLKRVVTQGGGTDSVNVDEITGNGDKIDRPDVLLRKRPWKGCLKKASKMCKKACKAAVKDACDYYDCKKKLKKGLKKECKKSCKRQFLDDY
ncbi:unnamed protein product [Arctia plantaginis]|uniref:Uncharacterized protein n=1 Tax=Arctia plantaginis TaxID=874455 RepID=A0A8S0ZL91_ARCPL|nr:unnamed protein product [Arctia plantaginis]